MSFGEILLVEDDSAIATVIAAALEEDGHRVRHAESLAARDSLLATQAFDAMLTDVVLGDGDGIESLGRVRAAHPDLPVIVLSAQNTFDTALRVNEIAAFEYFPKPFDLDELARAVSQAIGQRVKQGPPAEELERGSPLIGRSRAMQDVFRMVTRVLGNDLTVLVTGESGTGKELVAEAIHTLGKRKTGPFIAINAAAIPSELIESELFGHEKGAFTGAIAQQIGKFEQANGGTLFLDEIGDMPIEAQTRLLRTLQSGKIRRIGGRQDIAVDVRIVAATNRDLVPMISAGRFREDLYYRLCVVPIELPPLRERKEDIALLAEHFLHEAQKEGLGHHVLSGDALSLLTDRQWRGNVRELRNLIFRLALLARDERIDTETVNSVLGNERIRAGQTIETGFKRAVNDWIEANNPAAGELYPAALAAFERPLIEHALQQTGGNQLRAARLLGINRNTLRKRIVDLAIEPGRISRTD